jgi:ribosomal protein S7
MLKIKINNNYMSKLFSKFINRLIFLNLKQKIENFIQYGFFYWKKQLNSISIFYFFEALLKVRPLVGFYSYIIKKKNKKKIKIKPYFMNFLARWQKAIYWLSRSIKMQNEKIYLNFINEIYNIIFFEKGNTIKQKMKFYKTIILFKTSKNYKW